MTVQDQGRQWEKEFCKKYGLKEHKGSGNQPFAKMDGSNSGILFSCKYTSDSDNKKSYRVTEKDLKEVYDAAKGPGGTATVPALAFSIGGAEPLVVMRMDDLVMLFAEQPELFKQKKADIKKVQADVPALFRQAD